MAALLVTTVAFAPSAAASSSPTVTPNQNAPVHGTVKDRITGPHTVNAQNRAAVEKFRQAHSRSAARHPADATNHDWWGTEVSPDSSALTGITATQSVDSSLLLSNSDDVLYAPTVKPRDGACIEVVTVHTSTAPQIWAWDWCTTSADQSVGATENVDSSFLSTYGTTVNGRGAYTVKVALTDPASNTWTAYLYNYATGTWQTFFTSSGTDQAGVSYGWDMFEYYSSVNPATGNVQVCDDLSGRTVESSSIQLQTSAGWAAADPTNSSIFPSATMDPSSYLCSGVNSSVVTPNSDWQVSVNGQQPRKH
ncbi:hypothetical protein [Kitasatospora kifunensis]|uniref:Uncharacterized protein n=1 Tax=Kitasatospora kifunensis TaxID=58351 RepID=A0A7W7R912_KITKI|nr:hypothetical protein [Kitasatospora kifunensis]MBB4927633.1 hypothetical protein [Kitasatospora kifunensis]